MASLSVKLRSKDDPFVKLVAAHTFQFDQFLRVLQFNTRLAKAVQELLEIGKTTGTMPHYEESKELTFCAIQIAGFLFRMYPKFVLYEDRFFAIPPELHYDADDVKGFKTAFELNFNVLGKLRSHVLGFSAIYDAKFSKQFKKFWSKTSISEHLLDDVIAHLSSLIISLYLQNKAK